MLVLCDWPYGLNDDWGSGDERGVVVLAVLIGEGGRVLEVCICACIPLRYTVYNILSSHHCPERKRMETWFTYSVQQLLL